MSTDLDPDLPPGLRRVPAPPGSDFPGPVALPTGDLLIGGEWESAQGGSRREAVDPSNGETLANGGDGRGRRRRPGDRRRR